jgi:hypothetical protein
LKKRKKRDIKPSTGDRPLELSDEIKSCRSSPAIGGRAKANPSSNTHPKQFSTFLFE